MAINPCPSCGQLDTIRKISAIVQEQTTHTTSRGGAIDSHGTLYAIAASHEGKSQTAINLSGYQTPKLKGTKRSVMGLLGMGYSVICWVSADPSELRTFDVSTWYLIAFTALCIVLFFWGLSLRRKYRSDYQEKLGKINQLNARNAAAWYCGRCDIRFDDTGAF